MSFLPDVTQTLPITAQPNCDDQVQLQKLLKDTNLLHLHSTFTEARVTMADLKEMSADELNQIGIKEYGSRKKIINSVASYKQQGKNNDL